MAAVQRVIVVGSGFAGSALALRLATAGIDIHVVEKKPTISTIGSGITMQGNSLRVLRELGVWEEAEASGFGFSGVGFRIPDPFGTLVNEIEDIRTGGPDLPATLGISRPVLARILLEHATCAGARFDFDREVVGLDQDATSATVTYADGSSETADLVVGADGARSAIRRLVGIADEPRPTGVAAWRVFLPRPASITRTEFIYGGPCYLAGFCPTGEESQYIYLLEPADPALAALSHGEQVAHVRGLAAAYHGPWDDISPLITDDVVVNYTVFEGHLVDGRWDRGRVVLIGDAVHTCPPTVAQGAAQSLEDALVLADLLIAAPALDDALFQELTDRRLPRARAVVEASLQITDWMVHPSPDADVPGTMVRISLLVGQPA